MKPTNIYGTFMLPSLDPAFHIGMIVGYFMADFEDVTECTVREHSWFLFTNMYTHALVLVFWIPRLAFVAMKKHVLQRQITIKVVQACSLMVMLNSVRGAQVLFIEQKYEESLCVTVQNKSIGDTIWWYELETSTFWAGLFCGMVYLLFCKMFGKKSDTYLLLQKETLDKATDKDLLMDNQFSLRLFTQYTLGLTTTVLLLQGELPENIIESSYALTIYIVSGIQFLQALIVAVFIFGYTWLQSKPKALRKILIAMVIILSWVSATILAIAITTYGSEGINHKAFIYVMILLVQNTLTPIVNWFYITEQKSVAETTEVEMQSEIDAIAKRNQILAENNAEAQMESQYSSQIVEYESIDLQIDSFTVGFCACIKYYRRQFNLSAEGLSIVLVSSIITMALQMVLITTFLTERTELGEDVDGFLIVHDKVWLVRVICAILLHQALVKEVRQGLTMLKYWLNISTRAQLKPPVKPIDHAKSWVEDTDRNFAEIKQNDVSRETSKSASDAMKKYYQELELYNIYEEFVFVNNLVPLTFCIVQFIISLLVELISLYIICEGSRVIDTIMDYIAMGVIAEIDSVYCESINLKIFRELGDDKMFPPPIFISKKNNNLKNSDRSWVNYILYGLYKFLKFLYFTAYYYFMPLLVYIFTYRVPSNQLCEFFDPEDDLFCPQPRLNHIPNIQ